MSKKNIYKPVTQQEWKVKEQQLLYSEESLLPQNLPHLKELRQAHNLSAIFDECHNYIYANEGLLKDKIFHEIVKLLTMKLYDEQNTTDGILQFGITSSEYRSILAHKPSNFEVRINKLFNTVRNKYQSLFSDDTLKLKPLTLAYIVGRLQFVNLTQTPGDVKGEAFQKFVYRHQRGDRGEFFTPHPIVRLAVEMMAPKSNEMVIDPACGSGGFLIQTIAHICRNNPNIDRRDYIQKHIYGIEFNPDVALSAMIQLAFEGGAGTEIICANALVENEEFNNAFDVVLTNPPFGSKGKIEEQKILKYYQLARKWNKSQKGDWEVTRNVLSGQSPEILFIEKCLKILRPGGRMAIVLPDGLLQNITNSHIRFWIRTQAKVLGVVSIPQEAFIPYGTGIKTSLLLLQKLPSDTEKVFMALIQKIGYDVKGQPIHKKTNDGKMVIGKSGLPIIDTDIDKIISEYSRFKNSGHEINQERIYTVPEKSLNTRLDVEHYKPEDRNLIEMLQTNGAKPLGELADILKETDDFRLASNSEIRYIAISDVDARTMQVVSYQIIKPHEAPSRATYRVRTGDIITAVSGASTGTERHATTLITEDEDGAICSNGFSVLRNIHGIEPLFLLSYMCTEYFLRQVRRLMTGHAIPAISIEDLSKVLVLVPPKEVQKQISDEIAKVLSMRKEVFKAGEKVIEEVGSLVDKMIKA
ncbi:MAG TPA: restriction endonuclease subunit M [Bacteroidetes bacterium]|mgnify:CR=1 FL=1|nr:N-6 DNA methylase [Bacteroidales bacterium]HCI57947.1 restriction endonuclease subunit M [Bacteroidota bacterium]HQJ89478.1 N-6 DNA methylase [Paludibacteraceae bacterium]